MIMVCSGSEHTDECGIAGHLRQYVLGEQGGGDCGVHRNHAEQTFTMRDIFEGLSSCGARYFTGFPRYSHTVSTGS